MDLSPLSPDAAQQALLGLLAAFRSSIAIVDGEGRLIAINPAWREFQEENPLIRGLDVGSDYLALCAKLLADADPRLSMVALGIQSAFKGKSPLLKLEYQQGENASMRWYGLQVTAPDRERGVPGVIIHSDITEKMRIQRELRRTESLFKITTENTTDLVAILDVRKGIVFASPSHLWTLAYSRFEMARINYAQLVHEEDRPFFNSMMEEGGKRSIDKTVHFRMCAKDGKVYFLECRVCTVESSPGDLGTLLLVSRDVSPKNYL